MSKSQILPTVFIVGVQKSGTTTIYNWLSQHPDIYGNPASKDFPFFSDEEIFQKGQGELSKFFTDAVGYQHVLGGEANLMYVPGALDRLFATFPEIKILAVLRNPASRCFSAWHYAVERGIETRDFTTAIEQEFKNLKYPDAREARQKDFLGHGMYYQQISKILSLFPKTNVKIILYEDLIIQSDNVLGDIFAFLGVDRSFKPVFTVKNKTLGGSRYSFLNKILYKKRPQKSSFSNILRQLISANMRMHIREFLVAMNRVKTPRLEFPETIRKELIRYYSDEVHSLENLLGIDLNDWKH